MSHAVKLQRQFNRRVKGKEYTKWLVVLPSKMIDDLGWREGEDLEPHVEGNVLRIRRPRTPKREAPR